MLPKAVPRPCLAGSTPAVLLVLNVAGHPSKALLVHPACLQDRPRSGQSSSVALEPPLPSRQFLSWAIFASFLPDQASRGMQCCLGRSHGTESSSAAAPSQAGKESAYRGQYLWRPQSRFFSIHPPTHVAEHSLHMQEPLCSGDRV